MNGNGIKYNCKIFLAIKNIQGEVITDKTTIAIVGNSDISKFRQKLAV